MLRTPIDFKEICSHHGLETALIASICTQKQDSACLVKAQCETEERIYFTFQTEIPALEKDRVKGYQTNTQKKLNLLGFLLTPKS